jgi:uncharacterized protein YfdQ (DUF2303 family)
MMDKSAIETLQQARQIEQANQALAPLMPEGSNKVVALPENHKLHNLESYQANRYRYRGTMCTESISAFAEYATSHNQKGATCFINAEIMNAQLIFNIGEKYAPGHCDHTAILGLEKTAPYSALLGIINKRQTQKEIAEFIEDWRDFITCFTEEDEEGNRQQIRLPRALHSVRNITIEAKAVSSNEERTFGATKSAMESIDVSKENLPPAIINFTCQPYADLNERTFSLRLGVLTTNPPGVTLRIVRQEQIGEEMAEEFKALLEVRLNSMEPKIPTLIGTFKP